MTIDYKIHNYNNKLLHSHRIVGHCKPLVVMKTNIFPSMSHAS